jgi:hypothetical protein
MRQQLGCAVSFSSVCTRKMENYQHDSECCREAEYPVFKLGEGDDRKHPVQISIPRHRIKTAFVTDLSILGRS